MIFSVYHLLSTYPKFSDRPENFHPGFYANLINALCSNMINKLKGTLNSSGYSLIVSNYLLIIQLLNDL